VERPGNKRIDVKMSPLSVGIAEVVLDKLSARAVIGADGKANVAELMVEQPAPASAPAPASSSAQTSSPTPASAAATAPPPVRVGKIIFRDCDFGFPGPFAQTQLLHYHRFRERPDIRLRAGRVRRQAPLTSRPR